MKTIAVAAAVAALFAQATPTPPVQDVVAVQAANVKWAEAKGHPKGRKKKREPRELPLAWGV